MGIDSSAFQLLVVPGAGVFSHDVVGLNREQGKGIPAVAVLTANPGDVLSQTTPVQVRLFDEVPKGALALGRALATRLGLRQTSAAFELRTHGFEHTRAQQVEFELTTDEPLEQVTRALNRDGQLGGRLFHFRGSESADGTELELSGRALRVRSIGPPPTGETVYELGPETRASLYSAGIRTPVDMVILADMSGSMNLNDVRESEELVEVKAGGILGWFGKTKTERRVTRITRMNALKRALERLLTLRLSNPGRVSRIALVSFTETCTARFPVNGGMVEFDDRSPPELVQRFRGAIALMIPKDAATDIGQALHHAAELLSKHSPPGNDRLIVLVSDGANWKPKSDDALGELVLGIAEPVSLMEHLRRHMGIRLHALGISSEQIFDAWWRETRPGQKPQPWAIPDHALLTELVKVGGGDPTRTGDTDVLLDYFSALGQGVSHTLAQLGSVALPTLGEKERTYLLDTAAAWAQQGALAAERDALHALHQELRTRLKHCQDAATELTKKQLFAYSDRGASVWGPIGSGFSELITSREGFERWWPRVHQLFFEARDPRTMPESKSDPKSQAKSKYPVPRVKEIFTSPRASDLNHLRNWVSHDFSVGSPESMRRTSRVLVNLIDRAELEDSDQKGWSTLQLRTLQELNALLDEASVAFSAAREERAREGAAASPPKVGSVPPPKPKPRPTLVFLEAPRL